MASRCPPCSSCSPRHARLGGTVEAVALSPDAEAAAGTLGEYGATTLHAGTDAAYGELLPGWPDCRRYCCAGCRAAAGPHPHRLHVPGARRRRPAGRQAGRAGDRQRARRFRQRRGQRQLVDLRRHPGRHHRVRRQEARTGLGATQVLRSGERRRGGGHDFAHLRGHRRAAPRRQGRPSGAPRQPLAQSSRRRRSSSVVAAGSATPRTSSCWSSSLR